MFLPRLFNHFSFCSFRLPWGAKKSTMWKIPLIGWSLFLCSEYLVDTIFPLFPFHHSCKKKNIDLNLELTNGLQLLRCDMYSVHSMSISF